MKILFNNNISEVRVYEKSLHRSGYEITWGKILVGRKFGIVPIFKKVYGLFSWHEYIGTIEDYCKDNKMYFENGEFYYKPFCQIWLNNGKCHELFFDTVEELSNYVDELKLLAPHIIIK
jgi:hypothetical protein